MLIKMDLYKIETEKLAAFRKNWFRSDTSVECALLLDLVQLRIML